MRHAHAAADNLCAPADRLQARLNIQRAMLIAPSFSMLSHETVMGVHHGVFQMTAGQPSRRLEETVTRFRP